MKVTEIRITEEGLRHAIAIAGPFTTYDTDGDAVYVEAPREAVEEHVGTENPAAKIIAEHEI